jgi:Holliday junction resolvase
MNSRTKGKRGELELAAELRRLGFASARRGRQYAGHPDAPDIADAIPGTHIECKRVEALNIDKAITQAITDAGEHLPLVMHRRSRRPWLLTLRLEDIWTLREILNDASPDG